MPVKKLGDHITFYRSQFLPFGGKTYEGTIFKVINPRGNVRYHVHVIVDQVKHRWLVFEHDVIKEPIVQLK